MKKTISTIVAVAKSTSLALAMFVATVMLNIRMATIKTRRILAGNSGENFVESALKILIAVVIGALLLAGLYMLFGDVVMPTLTQKIKDLFNYAG